MKKLTFLIPFLTCLALVALTRGVTAQFETPSRSFHNATGFRLEGRHLTVACESCHVGGQFGGTPKTCYDCHWIRRKDDRFQTRLGTQCEQCHRPTGWTDVRWDHAVQSGMPLNADHKGIACESCHKGGQFRSGTSACIDCHQKDFAATTAPNHLAAGFPTACEVCHRPSEPTWRNGGGGGFNHNAVFALQGRHASVSCVSCHKNNVYKGTSRDCVGCHLANYNATRNPNHAAAGFSTACETCHRPTDTAWVGNGGFNHSAIFALVGPHASAACASCHKNGVYKGTSRDCVGCHRDKYDATRSPSHAAAGFSTSCETCHRASDSAWAGAGGFNHNSIFALVGRHASAACTTCHVNGVYRGTSRDCVGCHRDKYTATRNPPHAASGFSTACDSCHRPIDNTWTGVTFNHSAIFALVGRHATTACTNCHVNNVYKGTSRSCVGCHQAQYNATRNPNHASAGFGTTCDTCHRATDTSWQQGTFNHTRFPLTGRHNVSCAQCHTSGNYSTFSCTVCHDRSKMDSEHRGRSGYVYDSKACYSCHPNGRS